MDLGWKFDLDFIKNIFAPLRDYNLDIQYLQKLVKDRLDSFTEDDKEKVRRMQSLKFISLTPYQYHKKVMLFTLPQFLISIYASMWSTKRIWSWKYVFHSHHVYAVMVTSVLYWGNYDIEDQVKRNLFRRIDMLCVLLSISSLYWRAWYYSHGLPKVTIGTTWMFVGLYMFSNYLNKRYPYHSIWSHSLAHTMTHLYNVHYFMIIHWIKLKRCQSHLR